MPSSTMLEHALSYLRRGWAVIPAHTATNGICSCQNLQCEDAGKHPWVSWTAYQERLPTEAQVRNWWGQWPNANIAIVIGPVSNLVVIDIDPRHGGDESIREWTPNLPNTAEVQTGGGGVHLYYSHPNEEVRRVTNVMPGVDIPVIIIAPPSVHSSGRSYEWDTGAHIEDDRFVVLPSLPSFVAEAALAVSGRGGEALDRSINLDALMEGNLRVSEGERNNTMARLYGLLYHIADDAESTAAMLNEKYFDPPPSDKSTGGMSDAELRKIIDSINRIERRKNAQANEIMAALEQEEAPPEDARMGMVNALWEKIGLPVVSDWFQLRGDVNEYLLVTPDREIRLGEDLLDYQKIRKAIFNQAGPLLTRMTNIVWESTAQPLRRLAREHIVEETDAEARTDLWLAEWFSLFPPLEVDEATAAGGLGSRAVVLNGVTWLKLESLARFLKNQLGEDMKPAAMRKLMTRADWRPVTLQLESGPVRAWRKGE